MKYWSILPETEFLEFVESYFPLIRLEKKRGRFSGIETTYELKGTDLTLDTKVDDGGWVTEFFIFEWKGGFFNGSSIRVHKSLDAKSVWQQTAVPSNGTESWGPPKVVEKTYLEYDRIWDEVHLFFYELYPENSKQHHRQRIIDSLC